MVGIELYLNGYHGNEYDTMVLNNQLLTEQIFNHICFEKQNHSKKWFQIIWVARSICIFIESQTVLA